jgi:hypothetical protein
LAFYVWLILLNIMFSRFVHVTAYIKTLPFFLFARDQWLMHVILATLGERGFEIGSVGI